MSKLFISIYDWFKDRRSLLYAVLACLCVCLGALAFKVDFNENISSFFGEDEKSSAVFENIKIKDRIVIVVSGEDPDAMIESGERFADTLQVMLDRGLIKSVTSGVDESVVAGSTDFIYEYLPIFLDEADYVRLDSCLNKTTIRERIREAYELLVSPTGVFIKDVLLKDPLSIGTHLMSRFERFSGDMQYEIYGGHIFSPDMSVLMMFAEPSYGMGSTGDNALLVDFLESAAEEISRTSDAKVSCIGGPIVAVHNANQIKRDTGITLSVALLVIIVFIFLSFRRRRTIPLLLLPTIFGALFALAAVYLIQGHISAIAIGAGSVVLGIALSYSIHMISHGNHTDDPREIINDMASPLTIGSITTIGAFAALLFTNSPLLRDMGLFSVFALVGTVLFCLIFLPHFMGNSGKSENTKLLAAIEKWNTVSYESNKWIIAAVLVLGIASLFFFRDVEFDSDMANINYMPRHIVETENLLFNKVGDQNGEVIVACSSKNLEDASDAYVRLDSLLKALELDGRLDKYISVSDFVISPELQRERILRWNSFWEGRREDVASLVNASALECGLRPNAFGAFTGLLEKDFQICDYSEETMEGVAALSDWITPASDGTVLVSRIRLDDINKGTVYTMIDEIGDVSIIDRAYYSSKMVEDTSNDFDFILLISSLIVFIALLVSYGRLEIALLTFLPMCISWVLILALMSVFDIRFNIVNVILATFIFGIGDDFSIFIMDGLLQEYRDGKKVLSSHKSAIFFSAFTTVVGMGSLIFAVHPAIKSVAVISVIGLSVVVLVSYTVQPFLFRLLISNPVMKGGFPYTIGGILNTVYSFVYFLVGCIAARLYKSVQYLIPMRRVRKKESFHNLLYYFTRLFLNTMLTVKTTRINAGKEVFEKPAVIIANHQSFVDILLMLSMYPKIIMLTNNWVWKSPFFGKIVQYADYYHTADGYESLVDRLKERVAEGYSILVFPEGTRSADCSILRFHKGAFYLAEQLELDILPIMIYGAGQICAKKQGFYIKSGKLVAKVLDRVPYGCGMMGDSYQEQAKRFRAYFIEEYNRINSEYGVASNPYFRDALIKNYIYKGPVLEWYMRIKCRIDGFYELWDRLVPRNAIMTDVGCGYGQMCYMLSMLSPERVVCGLDYDEDKIVLANHCFLRKANISFLHADMVTCQMPQSDVFLFNDSLHYVCEASQKIVLEHCLENLNPGGMLIVRDGDATNDNEQRHIEETEVWSTKIIGFNKTVEELTFLTKDWMKDFANEHNLEIKIKKCDEKTSETLYILRRKDI